MAADNSGAVAAMEMILRQLQSPDNAVRNAAESAFNNAKNQPGPCILALSTLATKSEDRAVKDMGAVLLRRTAPELWGGTDATSKAIVKDQLFQGIRAEQNQDPRRKLCDTLSAIACTGSDASSNNDVNDLLPLLFELSKSPNAHDRESALYIFAQLTDLLSEKLQPHLAAFYEIFKRGLVDPDINVQVEALRATCAVFNTFESQACQQLAELIPLFMGPVSATLNAQDEVAARLCLDSLIESLENEAKCWRKYLAKVSELMLSIAASAELEEGTRQLGMEFLVAAAENLPFTCKKMGNYVERVLPIALQMMLEIDDDQDWYTRDDDDDDDEYSNYALGQEALDRLAIKLGGNAILPVAFTIITQYLANHESWQHRHAALLAISQIGEGCREQISEQLDKVTMMALKHFEDSHPRVRWAAVHCIGQMCTDFAPAMQKNFHAQIVPSLIKIMDDVNQPRVQSHGAAALINFCEEASPDVIQLYMEGLLTRLMNLLPSPRKLIQEQAVTAVASVADSAGVNFRPFYQSFMPDLKKVLRLSTDDKKLSKLRGKVMECVSIIGLVVGNEMFSPDSAEIMELLVKTQMAQLDPDDPQSYYLMQAYARICRCMKKDFIPYLRVVMPPLLEAASIKPEIEVMSALADEEQDDGVDTYIVGDKRIGIRTSALEDKATACNLLACFVNELKGGFIEYVQPVIQLFVPLLSFYYHDDCRNSAAQSLPDLLLCVAEQGDAFAQQYQELFQYIVSELIKCIPKEADVEVMVTKVESLGEIMGAQRIQDRALLKQCADCLLEALKDRAGRIDQRRQILEDEGYEELQEILGEEGPDNELLDRVADTIDSLCKSGGESFLSVFEEADGQNASLADVFGSFLHPNGSPVEKRVALCVFDDIIEFGGVAGLKYVEKLLPFMLVYAVDANAEIKQAATYGIGVTAEKGGELLERSGGSGVSSALEKVLSQPDARSEANEVATDNAISAVAKIVEFRPTALGNLPSFVQALLTYVPLKADLVEAKK
uniref:Importin N-terminal domain-containing protein n=1 Tax=Rhodosorus marinus TaxID=101924 RepID=A0A7S2ZHW7_9RHOD|mmetsp:Transcript_18770/g.75371  ORF Transcript_18770/g.75371 Transcript_18770/m.75371 type:complete len:1008 (+) Transcript_18770:113-3136(+)